MIVTRFYLHIHVSLTKWHVSNSSFVCFRTLCSRLLHYPYFKDKNLNSGKWNPYLKHNRDWFRILDWLTPNTLESACLSVHLLHHPRFSLPQSLAFTYFLFLFWCPHTSWSLYNFLAMVIVCNKILWLFDSSFFFSLMARAITMSNWLKIIPEVKALSSSNVLASQFYVIVDVLLNFSYCLNLLYDKNNNSIYFTKSLNIKWVEEK